MECRIEENLVDCTCGSLNCARRGRCCECVANHRAKGQLPGCLMPMELRDKGVRSIEDFVRYYSAQGA